MKIKGLLKRLAIPVLALPRIVKRLIVLVVDASMCALSLWLALFLRLGIFIPLEGAVFWALVTSIIIAIPLFMVYGLYRAIFRYSGAPSLLAYARAVLVYGVIYAAIFTVIGFNGVPRTIGLLQPILLLLMIAATRGLARYWLGGDDHRTTVKARRSRVLIYGAGSVGRQLAAALTNSVEMQVMGFLDDDPKLTSHTLNGVMIYDPAELPHLAAALQAHAVLLAMPSLGRSQRNIIIDRVKAAHLQVRTLPSLIELAQGKVSVSAIRELDIDDLLGRDIVAPFQHLLAHNITDKVVMITGAGGSIGAELCRQIIKLAPKKLLLLEHSEYALYTIQQELLLLSDTEVEVIALLGSVTDNARLSEVISAYKPYTIYHAAAYKHVPLVEHNVAQGIENNVMGTLLTAQVASENDVKNFVLISTDKAVRPTNVMGASKRLAEMVLQAMDEQQKNLATPTCFSMVRFGNVLGSSGSVVPLFREQIKEGGPITLTHPDITRYFMTIPEAAQLVIQASSLAKGGEVFVLDMGGPVRIMDLARQMIALSGLSERTLEDPFGDIEIVITGLRPGEKLYEELLIGDNPQPTIHPRILQAKEKYLPSDMLSPQLDAMRALLLGRDKEAIQCLLEQLVVDYHPTGANLDWMAQSH